MASILRTGASRSLFRSLHASLTTSKSTPNTTIRTQLHTLSRRPQLATPKTLALVRWQSKASSGGREPVDDVNTKREERLQEKTLKPTPESVSTSSTTLPAIGGENPRGGSAEVEAEQDHKMGGIASDLQTIRDTFSLEDVPRQAYYMGMAGVVPYAATSLSTVFCAYELSRAHEAGTGLILSDKTAELLLHIIEPLQVGYGAVIISFLGAIHWGLEWAKYGGEQGYPRYMIGVVSTAAAWPTILLPVEYALIAQFLVFNFLYYTDSRASKRGWAPHWYGVYRFVLTFIVGGSIVISLIGRGQVTDQIGRLPGPADRIRELQSWRESSGETEEQARRRMLAEKEEAEEEDEE